MIGVRTQALHCITAVQGAHITRLYMLSCTRRWCGPQLSRVCIPDRRTIHARVSRALRSRRAFGADLKLSCSIYMYQKCRTRVVAMRLWRARPAPARTPTRRAASDHRGNHSRMQHTLRMHMPHAIHLLEQPRPTLCARNETATHTARQNSCSKVHHGREVKA